MSSGPQSCRDDEDDWCAFKKERGLQKVEWRVGSAEARAAIKIVQGNQYLNGTLLKLDVIHKVQQDALISTQIKERAELVKALALLEKLA